MLAKKETNKPKSLIGTIWEVPMHYNKYNKRDAFETYRFNGNFLFVTRENSDAVVGVIIPSEKMFNGCKHDYANNRVPIRAYVRGYLLEFYRNRLIRQVQIHEIPFTTKWHMYMLYSEHLVHPAMKKFQTAVYNYVKKVQKEKSKKITKKKLDKSKKI